MEFGAIFADTSCWSDPNLLEMIKGSAEMIRAQGLDTLLDMYGDITWSPKSRTARPELVTDFRREFGGNDPASFSAALEMVAGLDHRGALAGLKPPALVIWGANDGLTPRDQTDLLVASVPGAQLVVIPEAGHMSNLEEPDAFNKAIVSFFAEHPCSP